MKKDDIMKEALLAWCYNMIEEMMAAGEKPRTKPWYDPSKGADYHYQKALNHWNTHGIDDLDDSNTTTCRRIIMRLLMREFLKEHTVGGYDD